jgi:hypothetical protein
LTTSRSGDIARARKQSWFKFPIDIMASVSELVNRQGIYPPIPEAEHVVAKFVQMKGMSPDECIKKKEEYRQIFRC